MYSGCSKNCSSAKVSHIDWCFDATTRGPAGIRSSPRYSTVTLQTTRSSQMLEAAHHCAILMIAPRGITKVGIATINQPISSR